jgi:biotin transport system substrate-specific component
VSPFDELLWAIIGLILTIGGTFIEAAIPIPTWPLHLETITTYPLGVTLQVGAVLLVACLGGRNAAALSQIAYLILGLSGFQIFAYGGGFDYIREPTFGYLLGFLPGAWVCGYLAFRKAPSLESLSLSCLAGLGAIHGLGLLYLGGMRLFGGLQEPWWVAGWQYSVLPLPGQLVMGCGVVVVSIILRRSLFY